MPKKLHIVCSKKRCKKLFVNVSILGKHSRNDSITTEQTILYVLVNINDEVRVQLPSVSQSLLRKTKERAQKIYDSLSEIGVDKIKRIQTFTAVTISSTYVFIRMILIMF